MPLTTRARACMRVEVWMYVVPGSFGEGALRGMRVHREPLFRRCAELAIPYCEYPATTMRGR